jgi:muramidase (phage lysozyme)
MAMATSGDTPIPSDIIREGLTNDQVEFLKRNFAEEASHQGLIATFQATSQPDGLMTLVVHFARQGNISTSPPPGQRTAPSARGGTTPPAPDQSTTLAENQKVERFRPMLDFIAKHEGTADQPGGGYNTSLGFGMFIVGGEQRLIEMTLLQIDVLQTQILNNPKNDFNSSAIGRYQIVRTTLRGLKKQLGLSQTDLFDQTLQDKLGVTLILERGRNVSGLRLEFASLQNVSPVDILAAFDADGSVQA